MRLGTFLLAVAALAAFLAALAVADRVFSPIPPGVGLADGKERPDVSAPVPGASRGPTPPTSPPAGTQNPPGITQAPLGSAPAAPPAPPFAPVPVDVPYTHATLHDRVATLARQVDSGDTRGAAELARLLDECAGAPHRMAIWGGCGTRGRECEAQATRYREILESCRNVPYDLVERRQQFRDLAARGR